MQIVANIFLSMLPYLAMAIPIIALVRSMILRQFRSQGIHTTVVREVLVWIFILYIVGIASQTILPQVALSSDICFREPVAVFVRLWISFGQF